MANNDLNTGELSTKKSHEKSDVNFNVEMFLNFILTQV